ncbi:hypothetical protein [Halobacteriovorax sp.]|uniref:hypothetical protein n=1 Tax=Halobacteriovorax sp. TaxID=2020862 RepID=UPI0035670052
MLYTILSLFIFSAAQAEFDQFNIAIYEKCHKQLTNRRIKRNSNVVEQIKSQKLTSPQACLNLMDKASLNKDLLLKNQTSESIVILKNIHLLHSSWFKVFNLNRETQDHGVTNVIDSNQMSYQFTAALLNSDIAYSSIFTSEDTLSAKRKDSHRNIFSNDKDIQGRRSKIDGTGMRKWQVGGIKDNPDDYGDVYFFRPRLVEFGPLVGFQKVEEHLYFTRLQNGKHIGKSSLTKNIFPGVFGSIPYLILNLGHDNQTTDGGNKIHRRFASNFFSDFLCRDLPVLLPEDIRPVKSSKLTFRNKKTCMGCHQTMDQFAKLTANLEPFNAGEVHTNAYTFRSIYRHKFINNAKYKYTDSDKDFYRKKHVSKLYFRDLHGKLIDKEIKSYNQLGEMISSIDDPYLCTASRYFTFLTGIDVDINNFSKVPKNNSLKDFLLKLTQDLKKNQNPINIFKMVFSSNFYLQRDIAHE